MKSLKYACHSLMGPLDSSHIMTSMRVSQPVKDCHSSTVNRVRRVELSELSTCLAGMWNRGVWANEGSVNAAARGESANWNTLDGSGAVAHTIVGNELENLSVYPAAVLFEAAQQLLAIKGNLHGVKQ